MVPLFQKYQELKKRLPYISLGKFPTKVERLHNIEKYLHIKNLYIKRDDLSSEIYGGNKVRKLEFLLAGALKKKAKQVLTFGYTGSNHAVATAIHAKNLNLKTILILQKQLNSQHLRENILLNFFFAHAELHHYSNMISAIGGTLFQLIRHKIINGKFPHIIPIGGSSSIGSIGYVNAAFELYEQIIKGEIPTPDVIYVALGSMGTAVGLALGLRALGLKSKIIGVRVVDKSKANWFFVKNLFYRTNHVLHKLDSNFSKYKFNKELFSIYKGFYGGKYALPTEAGENAIDLLSRNASIKLDNTYTAKTFAALIEDSKKHILKNKVVLFWNTYNSADIVQKIKNSDYMKLPKVFHSYFKSVG